MKIKKIIISLFICCFFFLTFNLNVEANTDIEIINVSLGNAQGELKFIPNKFDFKVGKKYKLILDNPSPEKHYFTAKDFADASWTQKVQAGKVEIKGAIHELELKPEGTADWVFVPQKEGIYQLYCSIKGHKEAGMIGQLTINN
ncbi:MAG: biphenyl 2,3-dioxygenase [Cyanobacteria bacterium]|nr:biphenyl 2,3-dioxygenase [Cyanobacteria bacterium CG_2015-16_32_12]NCO77951.1 biphenyl 2,3-dioxygenase [Cyanobacteria bacterium CG_2015-22_32_23]NCQ03888.1 biphenyl 2,3-dioxygenase [Cyanobacteria bacterium CG_2015-09_32_10]NCQ42741.1 biphenyl 2,3-dioxygenase [Cyanobacteria bacterium CG_2015-04_32_10]NCS85138.1 biphenyl 2,3-dioxygenase [Cyanobacteria bacterium CG_2015-02_32_10]